MAISESFQTLLAEGKVAACCASLYESEPVRWFLGGELHPGGEASTRRALALVELGAGDRLLDVGAGAGTSAMLATRECGCEVVGVDLGERAVAGARAAAAADGLEERVTFVPADAQRLPFEDASFNAVLSECSLSTFADKPRAVAEMRRVLRPGGRVAISDVTVDPARVPERLQGPIATLACVGGALPLTGYEELLAESGLSPFAVERFDGEAARLAERVEDRLRAARILDRCRESEWCPFGFDQAIELVGLARRSIREGALGYGLVVARC